MYEIVKYENPGVNFYAGTYPVARDVFAVDEGEETKIKKGSPVVKGETGVKAATADDLEQMIGIANSDPVGKTVSVDFTGEILLSAVVLPETVEADKMVEEARKHCIFLRTPANGFDEKAE